MAIKSVTRENIQAILDSLGLKSFTRPFSGLIDSGDFGTVGTYLPISAEEYSKLPEELRQYVYPIASGRYGIICFLPRTFEAIDGGKVVKVDISFAKGKISRFEYTTDLGGVFEIVHPLRQEKLLVYAKNKKLLDNETKKALSASNKSAKPTAKAAKTTKKVTKSKAASETAAVKKAAKTSKTTKTAASVKATKNTKTTKITKTTAAPEPAKTLKIIKTFKANKTEKKPKA